MDIAIRNLTKKRIDGELITRLAKKVLKGENSKIEELSIVVVGKKRIRTLNKKYRGIDKATDVLSFGDKVNEILICPDLIKKENFRLIIVHGVLHILGYDHGEAMDKKQNCYLK